MEFFNGCFILSSEVKGIQVCGKGLPECDSLNIDLGDNCVQPFHLFKDVY